MLFGQTKSTLGGGGDVIMFLCILGGALFGNFFGNSYVQKFDRKMRSIMLNTIKTDGGWNSCSKKKQFGIFLSAFNLNVVEFM